MATAQQAQEKVHTDAQLGFPAKGSLRRIPFPQLVREIADQQLTGSLYLLSGQTKKVVFFEEGKPVFVRSNVLSECLGQVLATEGLITPEQCEQTLEAIRRTGKKQGELLVEMGILSDGNLRYGLEAQLRTKLFDIFSWEDGRYQFKPDPPNLDFGVRLALNAPGVIIGAIQEHYTDERARLALAPLGQKYVDFDLHDDDARRSSLDLLPEELYYAEQLDGSRTIDEVLSHPPDLPVPTPHALLYGLIQSGLANLSDTQGTPRPSKAPPILEPGGPSDEELEPGFEAQDVVTEYEDTPLPGAMPQPQGILGDHEDDFAGVDEEVENSARLALQGRSNVEFTQDLAAAEPESVEETFDDDELSSEDSLSEGQIQAADDADISEDFGDVELIDEAGNAVSSTLVGMDALDTTGVTDIEAEAAPEQPAPQPVDAPPPPPTGTGEPSSPAAPEPEPPAPVDKADEGPAALKNTTVEPMPGPPPSADAGPAAAPAPSAAPVTPAPTTDDAESLDDLEVDDDLMLSGGDGVELPADDELLDPDELDAVELPSTDIELPSSDELMAEAVELKPEDVEPVDELVGFDELDKIDLELPAGETPASEPATPATTTAPGSDSDNPEIIGAMRFNEAEMAMAQGDHPAVVSLLESAYDNGFDVAELHAMLAYARFMANGQTAQTAEHAFALLDYAQGMDPSLDLVHAYRGAVYKALGETIEARKALNVALELNPYCELAIELMDQL